MQTQQQQKKPIDPRSLAAKSWPESARLVARAAHSAAKDGGADDDTAMQIGYECGLREFLTGNGLPDSAINTIIHAHRTFGITSVKILKEGEK